MRGPRFTAVADKGIGRIEAATSLDRPSYVVETAIARPAQIAGRPAGRIGALLHGTRYGHPVHPMLVTIPIGTWTLALGLDLLAGLGVMRTSSAARSAEAALKAGAAGAVAAAASGLADWQHTNGRDRRVASVHGLINSVALGLNLLSIALRGRGRHGAGRLASGAGWICMSLGGYLGGHLVYRRRIGVDHADRLPEPRDFQPVLDVSDLREDRPVRVEVWDETTRQPVGIAVVRHQGRVHAIGARCAHMGGPLDEGWVLDGALVCPWHGSRFTLETGRPETGPATCPQPRYQVRIRDDRVEVRREQEPGDDVTVATTSASRPASSDTAPATPAQAGKKADEVLTDHHHLIRRLFDAIEAAPPDDPQRRDLMRTLASELEIHEYIEDHVFYPAVYPVSEDVPIAHSEHRQMADLLAVTLKLNTSTPAFEAHVRALHAAVEHHAGSEERSMFVHAQRLGEPRLRELGQALEQLQEQQRTARFQRAFRDLKIRLLEGPYPGS